VVVQNVAMIEIATFRIVGGEDAFLELDQRIQTEFVYQQPGLVRRTTARAEDGEWAVITVWSSAAHADAAAEAWSQHPLHVAMRHVTATKSASERRYEALTG
jgi:heme-degrading monooxygenase HmoA